MRITIAENAFPYQVVITPNDGGKVVLIAINCIEAYQDTYKEYCDDEPFRRVDTFTFSKGVTI